MNTTISILFESLRSMQKPLVCGLLLSVFAASGQAQLNVAGNRLLSGLNLPFVTLEQDMGFGTALAAGDFDGNGVDDLAIGIPQKSANNVIKAGQVVVLYAAGTTATNTGALMEQVLHQDILGVGDVAETGDFFGRTLATGDFNGDGFDDLVVAATQERVDGVGQAGIVHVFYGSFDGLVPLTEQTLTRAIAPGGVSFGLFGAALASGDFDGDGYDDLAIGAPFETVNGASRAGVVIVAYGTTSGIDTSSGERWTQWQLGSVTGLDDSESGDNFGSALAAGDFDGDFYDDLVAGAPIESLPGMPAIGAMNVIYGRPSGLHASDTAFIRLSPDYAQPNAYFANALAAGDLNADGIADIVVGAPRYNASETLFNTGGAFLVFGVLGLGPDEDRMIALNQGQTGASIEEGDRFGAAVAVGDFDADGYDDVVIGAWAEDIGSGTQAGAASVFHGAADHTNGPQIRLPGFTWHQEVHEVDGAAEVDDHFGFSLASGNFDGGSMDLAIGVPGETLAGVVETGAVQLLRSSLFVDDFESGDLSAWSQVSQ